MDVITRVRTNGRQEALENMETLGSVRLGLVVIWCTTSGGICVIHLLVQGHQEQ